MKAKKRDLLEPDIFDLMLATWVFASTDQEPIITYRGILHRLGYRSTDQEPIITNDTTGEMLPTDPSVEPDSHWRSQSTDERGPRAKAEPKRLGLAWQQFSSRATNSGMLRRPGQTSPINIDDLKDLVQKRGELFRQQVPEDRLQTWKEKLKTANREGTYLPGWICEKWDTKEERLKVITNIRHDDVFRSQFRYEPKAPPSELPLIEWGFQHIERLRKARYEARAGTATRKQMWLVFWVAVANVCVALTNVILTLRAHVHTN
jgi:hypothetical protein